ncbi:MAG TPA: acyl-CoA dehydrogenase family protein [Mycobacteriales bacterium]|jgi:alkylation response protein AidB-like acyl-CoA dehydrogenase|nr:acyl-CoA dehydrogenase family protein [Mycobacteriales bacterium]
MLVMLGPDQEVLHDTTSRFLDEQMPVATVRTLRDDAAGFDPKYWIRGAELGWTALLVSEEAGGGSVSGNPLQDLSLIAYEFGTHAAPGPLVPANIVAIALDAARGSHADALGAILSGEAIATWCFGEPAPGDRLDDIALTIEASGDELVLNGIKRPVESGAQADFLLVTGRTGHGLSQVLVPAGTAGVTVTALESADLTRRFASVKFDHVRLPASAAVGVLGEAAEQVHRQRNVAIVLHMAESTGAMQRSFDMTRAWVADRYSFGRALESYQEIKHRMADLLSWLQGAHAISDAAVAAMDRDDPVAEEFVSAAKSFIGEYAAELVQDCVQLHGGIGVTYEHDLHLHLRRVTVNRALYGTPSEHRRRLGALTIARELAS